MDRTVGEAFRDSIVVVWTRRVTRNLRSRSEDRDSGLPDRISSVLVWSVYLHRNVSSISYATITRENEMVARMDRIDRFTPAKVGGCVFGGAQPSHRDNLHFTEDFEQVTRHKPVTKGLQRGHIPRTQVKK